MHEKKLVYLDSLRILAALAIVLLHICTAVTGGFAMEQVGENAYLLYSVIPAMMRWAVPVFLMISGALLLNPEKDFSMKRYAGRMLGVLLVFGWGYAVLEEFFKVRRLSAGLFGRALLNVFQAKSWDHMWYLYMLLGLYLLTPMLKSFTAHAGRKQIRQLLLALGIFSCLIPSVNRFAGLFGRKIALSDLYLSLPYVFLYLLGWYIQRYCDCSKENRGKRWAAAGLAAAAVALNAAAEVFYVLNAREPWGWLGRQENVLNAAAAAGIFYLAKQSPGFRICETRLGSVLRRASFGIYLVHPFFINLLYKVLHVTPAQLHPAAAVPVFFAAVSALSVLAAVLLRRVPGLRRLM